MNDTNPIRKVKQGAYSSDWYSCDVIKDFYKKVPEVKMPWFRQQPPLFLASVAQVDEPLEIKMKISSDLYSLSLEPNLSVYLLSQH